MYRVRKIISGGQTGADQAGLIVARELKIETGGSVPKGWKTEAGPAPWLAEYGCKETNDDGYRVRTEKNVRDASGTIIFGGTQTPGSRLTVDFCRQHRKVFTVVSFGNPLLKPREELLRGINKVKLFLELYDITTLNVAGSRESRKPGIGEFTQEVLRGSLKKVR